jgi:hypothetical protein
MSEKFPTQPEQESEPTKYEARRPVESKPHHKHSEKETKAQDSIEQILKKIEAEAEPAEVIQSEVEEVEAKESTSLPVPINKSLKDQARKQSLQKVRRKLPTAERQFSKFIHNSVVEPISEVTAETVARPSGMLVGGLFSFVASVGVLVICRYYGYEYNFLIGLLAFVGGFICGILIELVFRSIKRFKSR